VNRPPQPPAERTSGASAGAATLEQLFQCLREESDALLGADVDKLTRAVRDKEQALRSLAAGLENADGPELREALRRARDLNERNARLLIPHICINRARIESLFGAARSGALYSADGHAASVEGRPAQRGVRA
jgi:flagellar biosynthesis/type III secretory pathway chaperone